ncbi:hypothetical protein SAMN05421818_12219 [Myroides phaeus]|uniref:Uncharacterized protein n=1 Tax=Myroides phaeus TaxID=702745 RepID=A0A1G8G3L2_9FLAO|nr:hypothetical protein SAMN05421818_12219 [Myroides phaeus]
MNIDEAYFYFSSEKKIALYLHLRYFENGK